VDRADQVEMPILLERSLAAWRRTGANSNAARACFSADNGTLPWNEAGPSARAERCDQVEGCFLNQRESTRLYALRAAASSAASRSRERVDHSDGMENTPNRLSGDNKSCQAPDGVARSASLHGLIILESALLCDLHPSIDQVVISDNHTSP
jgi:hypothetical protein